MLENQKNTSGLNWGSIAGWTIAVTGIFAAAIYWGGIAGRLPAMTYYYLPFCAAVLMAAIGIGGLQQESSQGSSKHQITAGLLAAALLLLFLLSFGLIEAHLLPTRWLDFGLFQLGDAQDFLGSTVELLYSGTFDDVRGRVFSNLLYAGLLHLGGFDLSLVGWVLTLLAALAAIAAALATFGLCGAVPAALIAYILFDFAHEHIGGTSTEIPGFIAGALSIPFLFRAIQVRSHGAFLIGFALLCAAMLVRIGAAFVLPALLLWAAIHLRGGLLARFSAVAAAVALALGLFVGNAALTRHVTPQSGGSFVNAINSWYAVIVEGQLILGQRDESGVIRDTLWVQIYKDHPEIERAPMAERPALKLKVLVNALTEHPGAAVVGAVRQIVKYVGPMRIYQFIEVKPLRIVLALLALLGMGRAFFEMWRGRSPYYDFFGLTALALILSQPFLFGGETRAPAPTVALLAVFPAIGCRTIVDLVRRRTGQPALFPPTGLASGRIWPTAYTLVALVVAAMLAGFAIGFAALGTHRASSTAMASCPSPSAHHFLLMPRAAVAAARLPGALAFARELGGRHTPVVSVGFGIEPAHLARWSAAIASLAERSFVGYGIDVADSRLRGPVFAAALAQDQPAIICAALAPPYGYRQN
jgi:hypothetical protein